MNSGNMIRMSLVYFMLGDQYVLLAPKKTKLCIGKLVGAGGGCKNGETMRECASREVSEECGGVTVSPEKLAYVAMARFHNIRADSLPYMCHVYVFLARAWHGEFSATAELGNHLPYEIDHLPLEKLMLSDQDWLPVVLNGNRFGKNYKYEIEAWYGPNFESLLRPTVIVQVNQLTEA